MKFGLEQRIIEKIVSVIDMCKVVQKAVIFGSRARGDFRYNSDIDIAIYMDGKPYPGFFADLDNAAEIYKINVIDMASVTNEKLRQNIEREGIEIYRRNN
ncbi:nucleotidyltransferase family protein [Carboxydocella sp. JDF658]|uniref:nucleotidyltransferase family protein n=1 Tax=Carboxydocella sp. JDF658 TaxID=1926600 RepID=UPI0009AE800B|nr:nucleotidyltransferase domain-containing protein [Carboxydocella sp. JDF658]GAW32614.1 nucleotidyltransferase [Carboxydocella sp. JDF658]